MVSKATQETFDKSVEASVGAVLQHFEWLGLPDDSEMEDLSEELELAIRNVMTALL